MQNVTTAIMPMSSLNSHLSGLEQQSHAAGQLLLALLQQPCSTKQHCHVRIVLHVISNILSYACSMKTHTPGAAKVESKQAVACRTNTACLHNLNQAVWCWYEANWGSWHCMCLQLGTHPTSVHPAWMRALELNIHSLLNRQSIHVST